MGTLPKAVLIISVLTSAACLSCGARVPSLWSQADAKTWLVDDTGRKLSALGVRGRAVVDVDSWGCFSDSHYRLDFTGGEQLEASVVRVSSDRKHEKDLGSVVLGVGDVRRLDRAISIYRADHPCMSSGYTELRSSWYDGSRRIDKEKLEYSCCGACEDLDVLHIGELIERAPRYDT